VIAAEPTTTVVTGQSDMEAIRLQVQQLRQKLADTTDAYRRAAREHDFAQTMSLLRARSLLMRQLLESQCELLLALRNQPG
jgi:hypothetical protein